MLRHFPARTDGYKIEEYLHDIYDSDNGEPVCAVEVFGPPEAMRLVDGEETGPWVVGPADEVEAYTDKLRWDWEEQYRLEHPEG